MSYFRVLPGTRKPFIEMKGEEEVEHWGVNKRSIPLRNSFGVTTTIESGDCFESPDEEVVGLIGKAIERITQEEFEAWKNPPVPVITVEAPKKAKKFKTDALGDGVTQGA